MTICPIRSGRGLFVTAAFLAVLSVACFSLVSLPVLRNPETDGGAFRVVVGSVFALFFLYAGISTLRAVYHIRIAGDGTIALARGVGTTYIPARDIRQLEGLLARDYDGNDTWGLRIRTSQGTFRFGQFRNATAFADQVRAHHPGVVLGGMWPQGPPEPLHSRSAVHGRGRGR